MSYSYKILINCLIFFLQLLLGIKDTDDILVASTLICLSELVPILGADTVIGGKRSKLFTDGRPNSKTSLVTISNQKPDCNMFTTAKSLRDFHCSEDIYQRNNSVMNEFDKSLTLNERPSPVGGESVEEVVLSESLIKNLVESEDDWSDWDNSNRQLTTLEIAPTDTQSICEQEFAELQNQNEDGSNVLRHSIEEREKPVSRTTLLQKAALEAKKNIVDISELDIKNQKTDYSKKSGEEFDFFADMTPVIENPAVVNVAETDIITDFTSKLKFVPEDGPDDDEGWGESWNE